MKKVKITLSAAIIAAFGFAAMTFTSCTPEDKVCPIGIIGSDCDQEVRKNYYNTYKGNGYDKNDTNRKFEDWKLTFSERGTNAIDMNLEIKNNTNIAIANLETVLESNTDYKIVEKTVDNIKVSGYGTISETNASLNLTEIDGTDTNVYIFSTMIKQ